MWLPIIPGSAISSLLSFPSLRYRATSCSSTWATSVRPTERALWPPSFPKKKAVGYVGGDDDPNQQRMKKAFIAGARHTVPGIQALAIITGDYDNAAKGREAASILIGNGADVIWHTADVTGLGAIQGAVAGNIKVLGCFSDQTPLAPNNMATSFEMNLDGMVIHVAEAVAQRTFAGGTEWQPPVDQSWLLKSGSHGDHNPRLITAEQWAAFQKIWSDLAAHKIDVDAIVAA